MFCNTFKVDIDENLILNVEKGMYGLEDKNGKTIVPPIYSYISTPLGEDYLLCEDVCGGYGILHISGKILVSPVYDDLDIRDRRTFYVKINEYWGIVDRDENFIVYPQYANKDTADFEAKKK